MLASTEYTKFVSVTERCLCELDFQFRRNGSSALAEFEIIEPSYFRIVIEPNKVPKTQMIFIPSISLPKWTTVEIHFDLDASPDEREKSSKMIGALIRELAKSLAVEPWRGLGARQTMIEKKKWKELMMTAECSDLASQKA